MKRVILTALALTVVSFAASVAGDLSLTRPKPGPTMVVRIPPPLPVDAVRAAPLPPTPEVRAAAVRPAPRARRIEAVAPAPKPWSPRTHAAQKIDLDRAPKPENG